jgi:aminomethyltransferase
MKRTPLYDEHVKLGGKMVEFAGWEMPVQYSGVIAEHVAVRERVGLFDVSHMGEIWITGAEAERAVERLTCNKVSSLYDGKAQYSAILSSNGGVIDDVIVYRFTRERYLLCVNASNADKDFEWLKANNNTTAEIDNASAEYGQIAVQGPRAMELVAALCKGIDISTLKPFHFVEVDLVGDTVIIARTGYTGEDGVEVFVKSANTIELWRTLLELGATYGAVPCGLGARDSLRLEAALPLHGHELSADISALQSGLGWIVKFDKGDFIGREALLAEKAAGIPRKLVGFVLDEAGIARQGDTVRMPGHVTDSGVVTSGTKTPTVGKSLGMALLESSIATQDAQIECVVRGRAIKGHIVPLPFYRRSINH